MNKSKLSPEAVRVLKDVYVRGLEVNFHFRHPTPRRADGSSFPWSDWCTLRQECMGEEIRHVFLGGQWLEFTADVSYWLHWKDIGNDEFAGIDKRYTLTEQALELIGVPVP